MIDVIEYTKLYGDTVAVQSLSSGRAAILGYTMPIFSALIGAWLFSAVLSRRLWMGVGAAAVGVSLLLWHELTQLAGRPLGVLMALLGGMGTFAGPVIGAFTIIGLQNFLADRVGSWVTVIIGVIFVVCVLAFRRGLVGELQHLLRKRPH